MINSLMNLFKGEKIKWEDQAEPVAEATEAEVHIPALDIPVRIHIQAAVFVPVAAADRTEALAVRDRDFITDRVRRRIMDRDRIMHRIRRDRQDHREFIISAGAAQDREAVLTV